MSDEKIFKSRARQIKKPQQRYMPEYERLNTEPNVQNYDRSIFNRQGDAPAQKISHHVITNPNVRRPVPRQIRVTSGANQEHEWTKNTFDAPEEKEQYQPSEVYQPAHARPANPVTEQNNDVAPGDYVIMLNGKIVFVGSEAEAEDRVWSMATGTDDVEPMDVNKIMVFQRLNIKIGALFTK